MLDMEEVFAAKEISVKGIFGDVVTMLDMEEVFAAGVREAEEQHGAECRPFDRAIKGSWRCALARGLDVAESDWVNRWHCPLAGAGDGTPMTFAHWQRAVRLEVEARVRRAVAASLPAAIERSDWRSGCVHDALWKVSDCDIIARERDLLIDGEIKRAHPKMRRGTKAWAALAESVKVKANGVVRDRLRDDLRREFREYVHSVASTREYDRGSELRRVAAAVVWWRELARVGERFCGLEMTGLRGHADAVEAKFATVCEGVWRTILEAAEKVD